MTVDERREKARLRAARWREENRERLHNESGEFGVVTDR